MPAGEKALRLSVGLGDMAASRTFTGGISRINKDHGNPGQLCLVADERVQLEESPISKALSVGLPKPCPRRNTFEILKGYPSVCAFGYRDDLFGNTMVGELLKPRLAPADFLQMSFRRLGAVLLKCLSDLRGAFANGINPDTGKGISITCCGDIDDTLIYAEYAFRIDRRSVRKLYHDAKKEFAVLVDKIGLPFQLLSFQAQVLSENNGDLMSSVNGVNACGREVRKGKKTLIIDHGRVFLERALHLLVTFVGFFDLLEGSDNELRTERRESRSDGLVQGIVHLEGAETLLPKGILSYVIASRVEGFKGFVQRFSLWSIGK